MQQRTVEIVEDQGITSLREGMSVLGSRWALNIAMILMNEGRMRFNPIRKKLSEATPRSISRTLSWLVSTGMVERTVVPGKKIEVYYNLTAEGLKIMDGVWESVYPVLEHRGEVTRIR